MNASAGMVAPSLIVLGVAGYALWSHLNEGEAPAPAVAPTAKPKSDPLAASLTIPELGTWTGRDPFRLPGQAEPGKTAPASGSKPGDDLLKKLTRLLFRSVQGAADKGVEKGSEKSVDKGAEERRAKIRVALEGLALGGTSVGGGRSIAILNGHAYAEGETLDGVDRSLGPVVLAQVRASEVVLQSSAGSVTVGFPEATKPSSAPPAARVVADAPKRARKKFSTTTPSFKGKSRGSQ